MVQLLFILAALLGGYCCKTIPLNKSLLNRFLNGSILSILLIMGYEFGSNSVHLAEELLTLVRIISTFSVFLFVFNFSSVYVFIKLTHRQYQLKHHPVHANRKLYHYFIESSKYLIYVLAGMLIGVIFKWKLVYINYIISVVLLLILFIIGFQLREQNIPLKKIIANKTGLGLAVVITSSCMLSGLISAKILHMDAKTGLVLSSGFGWYTLSGILSSQLINHQIGTAAFFIDFLREIIAIILIPTLGRKQPIPMVGYSGATALDFTLPIIKTALGNEVIPVAITSGMILTILVPVLIPFIWTF